MLDALARQGNALVQIRLTQNESTTAATLDWLVHRDRSLAGLVSHHPSAAPETLSYLAHSDLDAVCSGLSGNRNTPPAVLDHLARSSPHIVVRINVAGNPSTPLETLKWSVQNDLNVKVRRRAQTFLDLRRGGAGRRGHKTPKRTSKRMAP